MTMWRLTHHQSIPWAPKGHYTIKQGNQKCDVFWLLLESHGNQQPKKKGVHRYPTTSKVFENEDHRYVLIDVEPTVGHEVLTD